MERELSGLRVLELASVLAGPSVGQFFAELGASLVKIENVKTKGDVTRSWVSGNEKEAPGGISAYFSSVNWGKRSLALNLGSQEGKEILHRLIPQCDIVLASFKHGDDQKLGADYKTLSSLNPAIIYGHITGYGINDTRTGYDAIIQAETGYMHMNGEPNGRSLKMPVALIDILAAHHLKEGILLALLKRQASGKGQYVHVSLFDAAISSLANQGTNWLVGQTIPSKMGQEHPNIVPYGRSFRTKDGRDVILAVGTDSQFRKLCDILDLNLAESEKFGTNNHRVVNRSELYDQLESSISNFESAILIAELEREAIPYGLINDVKQVMELEICAPMLLTNSGDGFHFNGIKNVAFTGMGGHASYAMDPPPRYGQHTMEIMQEMDYTDSKISELKSSGVIDW